MPKFVAPDIRVMLADLVAFGIGHPDGLEVLKNSVEYVVLSADPQRGNVVLNS